jgi:hypothetical protein
MTPREITCALMQAPKSSVHSSPGEHCLIGASFQRVEKVIVN